jgi:uncharacterized membrane protein YfcA
MSNPNKTPSNWARFSQIGIQMALTIALGTYLGHWLDGKFPNKIPVWTLVFSLASIAISLYTVIKQLPKE